MSVHSLGDTIIHRFLKVPYRLRVTKFRQSKRPTATIVLIHGIGNTANAWKELIPLLPSHVTVIGIDLLGFGRSPRPAWAQYSVKTQARSIVRTLLGMGMTQRPIIVGHSLGALVAIEIAKRYPVFIRELLLCSPPLYAPVVSEKKTFTKDTLLRELYRTARQNPEQLVRLSPLAVKLGFANKAFEVTDENVFAYIAALEASIINQTSLEDIKRLTIPIRILYGAFDAVVVGKHIRSVAVARPNVTVKRLIAGHEVTGSYTKAVARELEQRINQAYTKE